jgi:hypothetical protein
MYGFVCFLWYAVADGPVGPAEKSSKLPRIEAL